MEGQSDRAIGDRYGVTGTAIGQFRSKHGIRRDGRIDVPSAETRHVDPGEVKAGSESGLNPRPGLGAGED